jgi:hypothetical protein
MYAYILYAIGTAVALFGAKRLWEDGKHDCPDNEEICDDIDQLYSSTFKRPALLCCIRPLMYLFAWLSILPYVSTVFIVLDSTRVVKSYTLTTLVFTQTTLTCFTSIFKPFWSVFGLCLITSFNVCYFFYEGSTSKYQRFGVTENFSM